MLPQPAFAKAMAGRVDTQRFLVLNSKILNSKILNSKLRILHLNILDFTLFMYDINMGESTIFDG